MSYLGTIFSDLKLHTMYRYLIIAYMVFSHHSYGQTISLQTFINKNIEVKSVETKAGILTITGYKQGGALETHSVELGKNEVFADKKWSVHPYISLVTTPLKVRKAIDTFPQNAQTGLTNPGIGISIYNYKIDRYFSSGKKSTHLFSAGVILAPISEDLTPENTQDSEVPKSKQLFISAALSLSYTYNDVTFAFIPAGFDFATTTQGKKYIYQKKRWWGLGVGISTKLFGLF